MSNSQTCFCVFLILAIPLTQAEKTDSEQPIHINANNGCSLDQLKGSAVCNGNAVLTQGTLQIHADHIIATRNPQGVQTLLATGKIVTFRQKTDDREGQKDVWIEGQASRLDYTSLTHTAVLTTNARVKKGDDLVIGDVITYNTETQVYQSHGGSSNTANKGRVTVILQPQKQNTSDSSRKNP